MQNLISDIIMISRLESGDITFEREVLDLADVVRDCCANAKPAAEENGTTLTCAAERAVISASRKEMQELAGNLIQNAVRYNGAGGYIDVNLTADDEKIVLSVHNTNSYIEHSINSGFLNDSTGSTRAAARRWAAPAWGWRSSSMWRASTGQSGIDLDQGGWDHLHRHLPPGEGRRRPLSGRQGGKPKKQIARRRSHPGAPPLFCRFCGEPELRGRGRSGAGNRPPGGADFRG